ncbi:MULTISPECIES: PfkB family carbohydrate kinase [unclassified Microbacterium]|uniref:PfkB family carbohydrate kinase n=1 Tax=unclassified Microbacterium TaxID=2609290 RepID=UPI001443B0BC|nr:MULTISPECIES: PfkB family carbohydrate kinase [unclassified Microbacterium]
MTMDVDDLRTALAAVPPPSLVGVGDNVLDCYLHEDLAYPGGNALNVAAYSRLFFGGSAAFMGIMGDDRFADHVRGVLDEIGVDAARVRRVHGANGMAFVALDDDGDRRFVASNRGGVQSELRLRLSEVDHEYLARFARVHTSVYSSLEPELPAIAERGTRVSFDYSDDASPEVIRSTAPHVDVGFFSGGGLSDAEVEELGRYAVRCGIGSAVVTLGARGSLAFDAQSVHRTGIRPVTAVDALGAGDAFLTGFLAARAAGADLGDCLDVAATSGALACTLRGAFGYPVHAGDDARAQMLRHYPAPERRAST